LPAVCYITSTR